MADGGRRQARERALSLLYEAESKEISAVAVLAQLPVDPDPFTVAVLCGVTEHLRELDRLISDYARDWTIDRMPALDRALLRMAVYELCHRPDVPTGAVISEAVELAHRFSTDESGRFVNGMLARIAEAVRPSDPATGSQAEAVDAEAVGAEAAVDDEAASGQMVEHGLDQEW
ncbi:MAG: transcription antitermination factor NusB [Actinomycetota bacterium]|nr:transcription antitermination factor NusB [Actinomycetota bacterium]